ncbi:hypothetical protein [Pseudohaliea rubra]|uniref:Outer membrane protein beta-barrel domain-containing protein n=1 Tax=Pseudohaliea rubra DSM 19751 TaxID=1265313 RepID=A0A095VU49_9GAMM|nr:hypothetical protein [Pseudohaliea rubra]KGE04982.1 hypothetical protein HRUBRA_00455 [Pseudohaliea rubra DSM 19751]
MERLSITLATGAALLAAAASATAEGPYPRQTHEFSIGATRQTAETSALASVTELPAVNIDLRDLNVDGDHDSWFAEYSWRFRERWLLDAFAYQYQDSGRVTSTRDFNYDGVSFTAGALVDSTLKIDTYAIDLLYAVHQSPRSELLIGGGIHTLKLSAAFRGVVGAANTVESFSGASDDLLAPVPNLRARGTFAFSDRFGADLTVGWLSASVDDYDGSFAYAHARLRCRLGDRSSVSAGYQFTTADVSRRAGAGREVKFDAELHGPSLQFSWAF